MLDRGKQTAKFFNVSKGKPRKHASATLVCAFSTPTYRIFSTDRCGLCWLYVCDAVGVKNAYALKSAQQYAAETKTAPVVNKVYFKGEVPVRGGGLVPDA